MTLAGAVFGLPRAFFAAPRFSAVESGVGIASTDCMSSESESIKPDKVDLPYFDRDIGKYGVGGRRVRTRANLRNSIVDKNFTIALRKQYQLSAIMRGIEAGILVISN